MSGFIDDFDGTRLNQSVWFPYYLPAWSSRAQTQATYQIADSRLQLSIPTGQRLWCPDLHSVPLRVSGIQSGSFSGPVGSRHGQQRFRDDLTVAEEQPTFRGWLPGGGRVEVKCLMDLSRRSMASLWLSGFEEDPEEAGEICVMEIFGHSAVAGTVEVGTGVKKIHDPDLVEDFARPRLELDMSVDHVYSVEWDADRAHFYVDDERVHTASNPPTYPMQAMLAVFDFPDWGSPQDTHVPRFEIDWIAGSDR